MEKLKCEACGGTEIKKVGDDIFECQNCGLQYSTSEVKKIFEEVNGTVKIDKSSEEENLFSLAMKSFDKGDFKKTIELCEKVLTINLNNEDASIALELCQEFEKNPQLKICYWEADMTSEEGLELFYKEAEKTLKTDSIKSKIRVLSTKAEYYRFARLSGHRKATYVARNSYNPVSGITSADLTNYCLFSNALGAELDAIGLKSRECEDYYSPAQAVLFDIDKSAKEIFTKYSNKIIYNPLRIDFQKQQIFKSSLDKDSKDEDNVFCMRRIYMFNEEIYSECKFNCPSCVDDLNVFESVDAFEFLWMPMQIIDFEYGGNRYKALQYLTKDYPRVFLALYTGDTIYRDPVFIKAYLQGNTSQVFNMVKKYESDPRINYVPGNEYIKSCIESFEEYNKPFLRKAGIISNISSQSHSNDHVLSNNKQNKNVKEKHGNGLSIFILLLGCTMALFGTGGVLFLLVDGEILAMLGMAVFGLIGVFLIKIATKDLE